MVNNVYIVVLQGQLLDELLNGFFVAIYCQSPCDYRSWIVEAESIAAGKELKVSDRVSILSTHLSVNERPRLADRSSELEQRDRMLWCAMLHDC